MGMRMYNSLRFSVSLQDWVSAFRLQLYKTQHKTIPLILKNL